MDNMTIGIIILVAYFMFVKKPKPVEDIDRSREQSDLGSPETTRDTEARGALVNPIMPAVDRNRPDFDMRVSNTTPNIELLPVG